MFIEALQLQKHTHTQSLDTLYSII